jgi:FkbM family methyltransferase
MINKLKKLWEVYRKERYQENLRHVMDHKTGLTPAEHARLLAFPEFVPGEASLFGQPFSFSHGPSLIHSVDEIFKEEIYKFTSESPTPYIIDCGANIGLSVLYFKRLFPDSEIVAFEPDEKIFKILERNTNSLENVTIEKKAVWTEETTLEFFSEGALAGSVVTDFSNKNDIIEIEAVDLKKFLNRKVDFLKIDIEGGEYNLLPLIGPILRKIKPNIYLAPHPFLINGFFNKTFFSFINLSNLAIFFSFSFMLSFDNI